MASTSDEATTIASLVKLDEQYIEIQTALNNEIKQLKVNYAKKFQPLIDSRAEILSGTTKTEEGTSAIPGFWLRVLATAEEFEGYIEEWDVPVLKYLDDIRCENIDAEDDDLGFKVQFIFKENPYFTNTTITKTIKSEKPNAYIDQVEINEITCDTIEWKAGMDVTVEVVQKKKSGGGKKKPAKATTCPRDSFFRFFFRNLGPDHPLPEEDIVDEDDEEDEEEDDDEDRMQMYISQDYELSTSLRDFIVPHAIKWFTGEALGSEVDEDEEDYEDEDDEDEDENDEDSKNEVKDGKAKEDCKQQ